MGNFNINLSDIGSMSMDRIVVIGCFMLLGLLIYMLPDIMKAYAKYFK